MLRLGQLQEKDGDEASAEATFARVVDVAPDRIAEAQFHIGFTRFVRGDRSGALGAWQAGMASGPPAPTLQAQLLYWIARAMPSGSAEAHDALNRAVAAAPESYYGLRAQEQLGVSLEHCQPGRLTARPGWR